MATAKPKYLEVSAGVRYWEDATINGVEDEDGNLVPFRSGDIWKPVINLDSGVMLNWPEGTTASIHYKVCDQGEYWLQDESGERVAKWKGYYVPGCFLCQGGGGFGDYIILNVGEDGKIADWCKPDIVSEHWKAEPQPKQTGFCEKCNKPVQVKTRGKSQLLICVECGAVALPF